MSSSAIDLQPFPAIPLELKAEILSHCDVDTLAKASSASLAFLQLASPLLYRHITFVGPEGLEKFLSLRADVQVSALAPYLDLSLVHSITYIEVEEDYFQPGLVCAKQADLETVDDHDLEDVFVPHRLLPPGASGPMFTPLSIHSLHAQLESDNDVENDSDLWLLFDPVVARIERAPAHSMTEAVVIRNPDFPRWTRLRELTLVDAFTRGHLSFKGFPVGPVTLKYELSVDDPESSTVSFVVEDAHGLVDDDGNPTSSIGRLVIEVATERMKTVFLAQLSESPILGTTTVVVKPAGPAPTSFAASSAAVATSAT